MRKDPSLRLLVSVGLLVWTLVFVAGCASHPSFTPSDHPELNVSGNEALLSCAEYRLPTPSPRMNALRPWVECVQDVDQNLGAGMGPELSVFWRELGLIYSGLREEQWRPSWAPDLNLAVPALLRSLALQSSTADAVRFTPDEQAAALKYFPDASRVLHAQHWNVAATVENDSHLNHLQAAVAALSREHRTGGAMNVEAGQSSPPLCAILTDLETRARDLGRVWQDLRDLRAASPDPISFDASPAYAHYDARLAGLKSEIRAFRDSLARPPVGPNLQCPADPHAAKKVRNHAG